MATQQEIKQAQQRWQIRQQEIQSHASVLAAETKAEQLRRISRARTDYAFFVSYYFPHYTTDKVTGIPIPSAKFHIDAAKYIKGNANTRAVFMWARGHAKSTHMGVFIPMWLMAQEKLDIHMVVMVSKSQDSAINLISDIQAELQYNERYSHDFGKQFNPGQWEAGKFTTLETKVTFVALGRSQSPRGLKKIGCRPDYIIMDDLDDDELCLNEDRVKKATNWVEDALFPTQGAEGGRFIMVGNLISKNSVLANIAAKNGSHVTRVDIRNSKGLPSWPELWTEERIKEREDFMGFRAFQKEYMNNPINEGTVFPEMNWGKVPPLKKFRFLCCYGDPSPSNNRNKANSMKAVFLIGMADGKFYVIDGRVDRASNAEFVDWFYEINSSVPQGVQVYNLIENNTLQDPFYQQVFIPLFLAHPGAINISPDERKKPDKFSRIEGNLEPLNRQQRLILNADMKDNLHFKRLEEQFLLLTPRLGAPADGADCIEGGIWWLARKTANMADGSISLFKSKKNDKRI
ncbi:MAG TPA: hypothetical protein PKW49_03355 [Paludibacteraceae bacterium]|nr:hypothetical protein [Paludibacteraceae bacterium]HQK35606.1 hypothetical protein [Spirochaetales bacterium]